MKAYDYHRSERPQSSFGSFDLDALIRACLRLRPRATQRPRASVVPADEPHPDFEDTMPAARASMTPLP